MVAIGPRTLEFDGQALDLGRVMGQGGAALIDAEAQLAPRDLAELDTVDTQADATVVPRDALDSRQRGDRAPTVRQVGLWASAGVESGIEVTVVARVHVLDHVVVGIGEELEVGGLRIEAQEAEGGGAFAARRDVDREPSDGDTPLASAQVVEPDQGDGENRGGVALRGTGNGSPAVRAVTEEGARVRRREAVFQIGLDAELGELPFRELASQKEPEALAKDEAPTAAAQIGAGAAAEIEQEH